MIARYVIAYVATLVIFLAVDAVWLTIMATRLYKPTLGDVLLPNFLVAPAALFYIVFIVGILIFATAPAFASGHWATALIYGALFGFFSYGVYDFTNWSTLRNWNATITIADVIWGTVLTGTAATLGFLITQAISTAFKLG